ncbi:MAG TPA: hypothetical protein V6D11_07350 [Waterburya sp.]
MNESGISHSRLPTPDSRLPTYKSEGKRLATVVAETWSQTSAALH